MLLSTIQRRCTAPNVAAVPWPVLNQVVTDSHATVIRPADSMIWGSWRVALSVTAEGSARPADRILAQGSWCGNLARIEPGTRQMTAGRESGSDYWRAGWWPEAVEAL